MCIVIPQQAQGGKTLKDNVRIPVLPELSAIDFSRTADVRDLVRERHRQLFDAADDGFIDEYMDVIDDLFAGRHPGYQAIDTAYHDITHTLQATLCLVELILQRQRAGATPPVSADDFRRAVVAALFHDTGYLKKTGDLEGSGAKYTHLHEQRSCEFARAFLEQRGWQNDDIRFVENLIGSTGPRVNLADIDYRSEVERILGHAVCTADYIGQMSDPRYADKLEVLFNEFAESYRYQELPPEQWPFGDFEALLRSTPNFWGKFVQHKLNSECSGLWNYLEHPLSGANPYLEAIERNLATIRRRIDRLDNRAGQRPSTVSR
jgi:hypothetical protein